MTRKRIILVPSWFPSDSNPQDGIFFSEQAQALATRHDVIVVRPSLASFRSPGKAKLNTCTRDGLQLIESSALPRVPRSETAAVKALGRATEDGICAAKEGLDGRPDLILAMHADPAGWQSFTVAQKLGLPLVLSEHASFTDTFAKLPHYAQIQQVFQQADALTVPSEFLADRIRVQGLRGQACVIPNLVRTDYFTPGNAGENQTIILAAGNLSEVKGFPQLIEAYAQLEADQPGCQLQIAGEGPLRPQLEGQIQQLGLEQSITLLGRLSREELREAYRRCAIFVCSSKRETFSIVLAEAMACGKPVVSTRCGGPESFVHATNGCLVEPNDPAALAGGIRELLVRREHYAPENVRESVDAFGTDAFLDRYQVVFEALSQQKGPA